MKKKLDSMKTKKQYLLILIGIISLIIIAGSYLYFSYEEQNIKTEKHNELKAIAELKISQIAGWNKERLTDAKVFSQSPFFVDGMENWLASESNLPVRSELLKRFALISTDSLYSNIIITDPKGKSLLSLDLKHQRIDSATERFVQKAVAEKRILSTDLYRCQPYNEIHLDYIAPVIDENNAVIAALILRVNPDNYLYPLINEWPASSKTAETIIVEKDGDSVLYLNELSHRENTALRFRIPLTQNEIPAVKAAMGYQGILEGTGYHGAKVLAYISPVHGTPWVMIAQEDESEIYAALYFREKVIITFTILLILVLSVGLVWFYHYRQRNIYRELFVKEKELREYHQEFRTILYSIGDGVITTDMDGNVKQMNYVAEELTGWNETEANGKPIEEIFKIITEGTSTNVENPVHKVLKDGVIVGLANHTLLISKDGKEIPIADSGAPIRSEQGEIEGVVLVFHDVSTERDTQKLLDTRLRLFEYFSSHSLEELLTKTLDEVEKFTKSSIGFYHFVDSDKNTLSLQAWSTRTTKEFCKTEGKGLHYNINEAGVWVDCVHLRKPIIHNDYESLKNKKGMPEGHSHLVRELVVPIFRNNNVVAILGVGNKPTDYTEKDVEIATYLADVVWEIVEKKKADELREKSETRLVRAELASKAGNWELHLDTKMMIASKGAAKIYGIDWKEMDYEVVKKVPMPEYRSLMDNALKNLMEKNEVYDIEYKIRTVDTGEIKDIHSVAQFDKENRILFGVIQDITERKKIENTLKEREAFLNNMLTTMPIPVFYKDTNGNYIDANNSFVSLFGYSKEQLIGKNIFDLYPKELATVYLAKDKELFENQGIQVYESRFVGASGEIHDVIFHKTAFTNDKGEIAGLIGAVLDVTERKRAEEALRENEEIFNQLLKHSPIYIFFKDENIRSIRLSRNFEQMLNMPLEEIIGKSMDELFPSDLAKSMIEDDKKILNNGELVIVDEELNGRYYTTIKFPITIEGKPRYLAGFTIDITERKRAEEALRESEERHRTTLYSIGDGVIATNNRGFINQMNPIAENLTGWSELEAKNKPLEEIFKIINETTRNSVENPVHKVLKEGKIVGLANHTLLIAKDGKEIPIADSGAPIRNENGDIDGVVLVFRDQLKERAAQKILEESEAQLKQSQRVARIGYYIFDINSDSWTSSEMLDELFGIDKNYKHNAEGWLNLIHPDHREEMTAYLTHHILQEKKEFNKEYKILRKSDNAVFWVYGLGSLELDKNGNPVKMFGTIQDVTERIEAQNTIKNSLKEKEILLKEIHHRVKNNFQRIISLIALQTHLIDDQQILNIFEDLQNRLRTMSLIHELMYSTGDFAAVDVKNYIERLTHYLLRTYSSSGNVKLNLDLENFNLDLDTIIPCGLITNEIITNSLKYAFPDEAKGSINISFKKINGEFCLTFFDDGIGINNKIDFENITSLGLRLIDLLTKQIRGALEVVQPEKGLQFIIKFKGDS
ncbi:MAG: PAS domain S-box protein [Ignavibacteriaceae bacterium]|jgi:PAS domain S-box-containing protein